MWKQASKCALLGGLAVLLVRHLDPLTARPAPHLALVLVAVSVAAANHLLRGKTGSYDNVGVMGPTLPSVGQLVGQVGSRERSVHLPE